MRDHRKLKVFELADRLAVLVYEVTSNWPHHEAYGLTSQVRRSAVSIPSNIVEGSACETEAEFARFMTIAYRSARELEYQLSLAVRLDVIPSQASYKTTILDHEGYPHSACDLACETSKALAAFVSKLKS